jgi:hypothetical protein
LALADLHSTRQRAGQLEHELLALKARVAELEAGAYESIMAFNATQEESLEVPELVDATMAHMESVRKLWNIWAARKESAKQFNFANHCGCALCKQKDPSNEA